VRGRGPGWAGGGEFEEADLGTCIGARAGVGRPPRTPSWPTATERDGDVVGGPAPGGLGFRAVGVAPVTKSPLVAGLRRHGSGEPAAADEPPTHVRCRVDRRGPGGRHCFGSSAEVTRTPCEQTVTGEAIRHRSNDPSPEKPRRRQKRAPPLSDLDGPPGPSPRPSAFTVTPRTYVRSHGDRFRSVRLPLVRIELPATPPRRPEALLLPPQLPPTRVRGATQSRPRRGPPPSSTGIPHPAAPTPLRVRSAPPRRPRTPA
jgi:hypothetical protein